MEELLQLTPFYDDCCHCHSCVIRLLGRQCCCQRCKKRDNYTEGDGHHVVITRQSTLIAPRTMNFIQWCACFQKAYWRVQFKIVGQFIKKSKHQQVDCTYWCPFLPKGGRHRVGPDEHENDVKWKRRRPLFWIPLQWLSSLMHVSTNAMFGLRTDQWKRH